MSWTPFDFSLWLAALPVVICVAVIATLVTLQSRNAALVDVVWPLMIFAAGVAYALDADPRSPRLSWVLWLLALWALRHWLHVALRGRGRDQRLHWVFGALALLAWVVSLPLLGALNSVDPVGWLDYAGIALFAFGFGFQALADLQLKRFRADPARRDALMDRGLWRFTRHPNYFGDCAVGWGFGLIALSAGAWWALIGPVLQTALLLRISAAAYLDSDPGNRSPGYADYVMKTNAFFPGPPRK